MVQVSTLTARRLKNLCVKKLFHPVLSSFHQIHVPFQSFFHIISTQTLCSLLECLLTEDNTPADSPRELYEIYFVFACVWAFGGALFQDHVCEK